MEYLRIRQFKCFIDAEVTINELTVLAGANSNGKSSVIQAMLFARSYIELNASIHEGSDKYDLENLGDKNVPLNGSCNLLLGTSSRVINKNFDDTNVSVGFESDEYSVSISFEADVSVPKLWLSPSAIEKGGSFEKAPLLQRGFYYLNAERTGPRIQQAMNHSDFPNAGWQGEYTAQLINLEGGYWKVSDDRIYPNTKSSFIKDQVNHWLDFIMPGVAVKATTDYNTLISQILLENYYIANEPTLATNLGFGTSYLLPIIATGLIAKKGSYFILENPEVHLHPSAQSKVGQFLAYIAMAGVKVILETHSDHIINGVQLAAASKVIDSDKITINYFNQEQDVKQPFVKVIELNAKGELSEWPKGFFDQTQLDFMELMKLRGNVNHTKD